MSELHEQRKRVHDIGDPLGLAKKRLDEKKERLVAFVNPFHRALETLEWTTQGMPSNQLLEVELGLLTYE